MALYAIIGFLDESVLNSQDPPSPTGPAARSRKRCSAATSPARSSFKQVADLLNAPESTESRGRP